MDYRGSKLPIVESGYASETRESVFDEETSSAWDARLMSLQPTRKEVQDWFDRPCTSMKSLSMAFLHVILPVDRSSER